MKTITQRILYALALTLSTFAADARAQTTLSLTTLYSFSARSVDYPYDNSDGAYPEAAVVQGSDGNFYGTTTTGGGNGSGTVFKMTPAGKLATLHNFVTSDINGEFAVAPNALIEGDDGNFYGTTTYGGPEGTGTIFSITPAGVLTNLYSFSALDENYENTYGAYPLAPLVLGRDGNFYGTAADGGSADCGTIFKITPGGTLTRLHSFSGTDGVNPYAALAQGSDGNFYGTTLYGGADDEGTVFEMTPAGVLTTLHSFTKVDASGVNSDGALPEGALVQGRDGDFYGVAHTGGSNGTGTIFKITLAGKLITLYSFASTVVQGPSGGLVRGSDGNFYGTVEVGGSNEDGTIFQITPAGVLTTLHTFNDADGAFPNAHLIQGRDGNFYGTTEKGGSSDNGTVFRLNTHPVITSTIEVTAEVGHAFSYQITATGNPASYDASGLPSGLSVNAKTGLISGTPQKAGTFSVTLSAANAIDKGTATLTLTVAAAGTPYITSALTLSVPEDSAFSYQITATNSPTSYGVQNLPAGITVDRNTGVISGKHHGLGTVTLTLNAYNAKGKGSAYLSLRVYGAPIITSAATATSAVGKAFSYQIEAANEPTRYGFQDDVNGLSIDSSTGLISGIPKTSGTFSYTLNAYNRVGKGSRTLTLTVKAQ